MAPSANAKETPKSRLGPGSGTADWSKLEVSLKYCLVIAPRLGTEISSPSMKILNHSLSKDDT